MSNTAIIVSAGIVPGDLNNVAVEPGTTVGEVLELAGLDSDGYEIRLNGIKVDEESVVTTDNSRLYLVKPLKSA